MWGKIGIGIKSGRNQGRESGNGIQNRTENRIENEARITIESETGTEVENGTRVENECGIKSVTEIGIEIDTGIDIDIDQYKIKENNSTSMLVQLRVSTMRSKSPARKCRTTQVQSRFGIADERHHLLTIVVSHGPLSSVIDHRRRVTVTTSGTNELTCYPDYDTDRSV
ncbi:hypothetical protein EVAR_79747_1 [Eumeta japonica]|uniref:Uncharacterized protein n=1 Tax=Eumeta variegata TaxID=151549 RepID=A0A4C1T9G6_EUMVA|nr:hypothetical protein EVAR_79747_1 [Eumeta japonica]